MSPPPSPPLPAPAVPAREAQAAPGGALALALATTALADPRPWVYVAAEAREAERLQDELRFFGGGALEVFGFPDWETLPYDPFSPHPDIVSERLRTLARLADFRRGVLVVTADALLPRLPPVDYVSARSFRLARGETLALEPLRRRLVNAGYVSVSQVAGPGEFALRG